MLKSQVLQILSSTKLPPLVNHLPRNHSSLCVPFAHTPLALRPNTTIRRLHQCRAQEDDGGPVELFPSSVPIFSTDDDPSPIQVATSLLLTGAISVFLFRALRRRDRRSKEMQFRSTGAKKSVKEEALDTLKAMASSPVESKGPPSPVQALLGAISAGVIALILYKFTTTVEASLNRQTISDNYSVRQITITVRTIINGLCYLATFVFGVNSVGLFLYAGQLAINSFMEDPADAKPATKDEETSTVETPTNTSDNSEENRSLDDPQ